MAEDSLRNVYSKDISASFRGILRVSPNIENTDSGLPLGESPAWVSDSVGQYMPMKVNDRTIVFTQTDEAKPNRTEFHGSSEFYNSTTINVSNGNSFTLKDNNTTFDIKAKKPAKDDILLGDGINFVQGNLKEWVDKYIRESLLVENVVPVGTIIYTALKSEDLNLLPARYRNFYDFCHGQKINTATGSPYTPENYPELFTLMGTTVEQDGMFKLPDLRNKFIRSASSQETSLTIGEGVTQYTVSVPAHQAFTVDMPMSNLSEMSSVISRINENAEKYNNHFHHMWGNEMAYGNTWPAPYPTTPSAVGLDTGTNFLGYQIGKPRTDQNWYLRDVLNAYVTTGMTSGPKTMHTPTNWSVMALLATPAAKETKPYSIALVPLIKVK